MNATDLIQSYFDPDAVARLSHAAGLEPEVAGRVLNTGLPLQLQALTASAQTPEGEALIANALDSLPVFDSVGTALEESGGAANLRQAGELLSPALLGEAAQGLSAEVAAQTSVDPGQVQTLLQMALPLLLIALGQRGLKDGNIAPMLTGLGLGGAALAEAQAAPTEPASTEPAPTPPEKSAPAVTPADPAPADPAPADPTTPEGLLRYLQARFSGSVGQQIGAVAGFGGGVRKQAAMAAVPVVLAALVGKAGAGGKLGPLAAPFVPLTGEDGHINTDLLGSPVEVARIEGQGRGLLAGLFGDVNAVTGRLGSALGGSGDSSRRLLALLTPLVLSALGRAYPDGIGALPVGALAADSAGGLKAMLPSGFSSLGVLIASLAAGTPLPGTVAVAAAPPRAVIKPGAPVPATAKPSRPSPLKPSRTITYRPPPPPPARKRRLPLWPIPLLLLLLLGGCWVIQNRAAAPAGGVAAGAAQATFTDPQSGATVPADGFTLNGTGPAGETLSVFLNSSQVGRATVAADNTWAVDVARAAPEDQGPQTFTLKDSSGKELASLNVNVGGEGAAIATPGITPVPVTPDPVEPDPATQIPAAPASGAQGTDPQTSGSTTTTPETAGSAGSGDSSTTGGNAGTASDPPAAAGTVPTTTATPASGVGIDGTGTDGGETNGRGTNGAGTATAPVPSTGSGTTSLTSGTSAPTPGGATSGGTMPAKPTPTPDQPTPAQPTPARPVTATPAPATPRPVGPTAVITSPAQGARVPAGGLTLRGTGPTGAKFALYHSGLKSGTVNVRADGSWKTDIVDGAALPGPQIYDLRDAGGQVVARVSVQVAPRVQGEARVPGSSTVSSKPSVPGKPSVPAAPKGQGTTGATEGTPARAGAGEEVSAFATPPLPAARISVDSPASGAQVSSAGFALSGKGTPGQSFEVIEDGVSVGSLTIGADGTWTRQVPGPSVGARTYEIRVPGGQQAALVPVTVVAATDSAAGAACPRTLSVSLSDGETVTAPYRFGGVGSASSYVITARRDRKFLGMKTADLSADCTWNFLSRPGPSGGQTSQITYEVRPAGVSVNAEPAARLTLNIR
ncbi:DUF937 domain-containing protein [Deinococcus arenicola]|uniref:DUF937 domain-containing protein n=1 Tax=Deinococcus arenicola TaxID=2994950 RepID=A0ABU4DWF7_9DEIO|nr:DUF937 domain-containing protein [Deinococcus sp. ZS9-10]MDV6375994.1 DUF937 domain-containing protein [Deinococcus sp. ZS9-10]